MRFAQVEDIIRPYCSGCPGRHYTLNDVINVSIIPPARTVSVERHLQALVDKARKLVNSHLRPLTRAINRKKTQHGNMDAVKVMIGITHEFIGPFGGRVRRYGP